MEQRAQPEELEGQSSRGAKAAKKAEQQRGHSNTVLLIPSNKTRAKTVNYRSSLLQLAAKSLIPTLAYG